MDPILSGPALGIAMHLALAQQERRLEAEAMHQDLWRDAAMQSTLVPDREQSPRLYAQYPFDCVRYEAAFDRREFDWSGGVRTRDALTRDEPATSKPPEPTWRAKEPQRCQSGGSAWR